MVAPKRSENLKRQKSFWFLMTLLSVPIILALILLSYTLGGFYEHRNRFNLAAESKDGDLARRELEQLDSYYSFATKFGIGWLADRLFYQDTYIDKAVLNYLIGDYDNVAKDPNLQNNRDNHLTSQLIGSAKFRMAEARYQEAKTDAEKDRIIKNVVEEISEDFRLAVEKGPGPDIYFNHSFNYDLTVNPEDVKNAFEGPPVPRLKLSFKLPGEDKDPDGQDSQDRLDPTKPGGPSGSKKKG